MTDRKTCQNALFGFRLNSIAVLVACLLRGQTYQLVENCGNLLAAEFGRSGLHATVDR